MKNCLHKISYILCAAVLVLLPLCQVALGGESYRDGRVYNVTAYIEPGASVTDHLIGLFDSKEYIFSVTEPGLVSCTLGHNIAGSELTSQNVGWTLTLYEIYRPDGLKGQSRRELSQADLMVADVDVLSQDVGVGCGTYLLRVEATAAFSNADYTLGLNFTPSSDYEDECNDSVTRYSELELNDFVKGSCSKRSEGYDYDYYLINVPVDGYVIFIFEHEDLSIPQTSWYVTVSSLSGKEFCCLTSKLSTPRVESGKLGLTAGYYIIKVEPVMESSITYTLTTVYGEDGSREKELNDSPETATPLPKGTVLRGNLAPRFLGLDKDYFVITPEQAGVVTLKFAHNALTEDKIGWSVRVFDSQMNEVIRTTSKWTDTAVLISNLGLSAQPYYVCVESDSLTHSPEEYRISYTLSPDAFMETEPNDTLETANYIEADMFYTGAMLRAGVDFDVDCYSFELGKQTKIGVFLLHDAIAQSKEGWKISVLDANGNKITGFSSFWNVEISSTEELTLDAGTYYVTVETGLYGNEMPYQILVNQR